MNNKTLLIIGVIIILFFMQAKPVSKGVSDKGVMLKVYGWRDGAKVGELNIAGLQQSVVQYDPIGGGTILPGVDSISIEHTISQGPLSEVDVNVNTITGSFTTDGGGDLPTGDGRYNTALDIVTRAFKLLLGGADQIEESSPFGITDLEDDCDSVPYCTFRLQLDANFQDIDPDTGLEVTTAIPTEDSFGSIVLKVSSEVCSDSTPWGSCSGSGGGGKFCDDGQDLIDCADPTGCTPTNYAPTSCPCNTGYVDVGGICTSQDCIPGECVGTDANICDPSCTVVNCAIIQDCYECGQAGQGQGTPLGWLDETLNAAECPPAYDGVTPADSCHSIQHTCKYKGRKGEVSVSLQ